MNQSTALNILKSGNNVFLTGQAGSGKTYVINQYVSRLWSCGVQVAITASTGIAATHIGGVTIHSRAGIGIKDRLSQYDIELISQKENIYKNITGISVLIIDEISMLSATTLDMVSQVMQHIRQDYRAFGGVQVIMVGDFFQLPPVNKSGTKDFAFASKAWKLADSAICYLDTQHRQNDDDFTNILNALRTGDVSDSIIAQLTHRIGKTIEHKSPIKLYTHNIDVDRINLTELDVLETDEVDYQMTSVGDPKFVQLLKKGISPYDTLTLKIGAKVIFIKNNPVKGYMNGTTGVVTGYRGKDRYPIVEVNERTSIRVEPDSWNIEDAREIVASVTQIPLKLARAITVHKSQGMTLDAAEIDLSKSFESGQAYVALSRVKSLSGLSLLGLNTRGLEAHPLVLRGDRYFQDQSSGLVTQYTHLTDDDWSGLHRTFVEAIGGHYIAEADRIHTDKSLKPKPARKSKAKAGDTLLKTLELVKEKKTMEEIATIRELTHTTIIGHLLQIKQQYPDTSLKLYRPDTSQIKLVKTALTTLSQNPANANAQGQINTKMIYDYCDRKIDYATIKLCLMFL